MTDLFISMSLLIGGGFAFVSALGVLRFPDFYSRLHAAAKASTFGLGFTGLAAALALGSLSAWFKIAVSLAILFITLPIGAHLLGRAIMQKSPPPTDHLNKK